MGEKNIISINILSSLGRTNNRLFVIAKLCADRD
jgi:hypothetical protein